MSVLVEVRGEQDQVFVGEGMDHGINLRPYVHALYTLENGGCNPYVLAYPFLRTGAFFLRSKIELGYRFRLLAEVSAEDYKGVGQAYDYVLWYGPNIGKETVIEREMDLVLDDEAVRIYGKPDDDSRG